MPLSGKRPRKWTSQGPLAAVEKRYLTAGLGCPLGRTWPTAKAIAFFSCLPRLPSSVWTRHRAVKRGKSGGLRWHNVPGGWKGKEW